MRLEDLIKPKTQDFIELELYKKLGIQFKEENDETKTIDTDIDTDTDIDININVESFESFLQKQKQQKEQKTQKPTKDDILLGDKAINDFNTQVEFYQKHDLCFGVIDESNIYVINNNIFFIKADLSPIVDKYYINIKTIYSKTNIYLPPELRDNTELPFKTRNTLCFYSLGKIIQMLLFHSIELEREKIHKMLGNTSLFFCLDRATKENPNHRYLILI